MAFRLALDVGNRGVGLLLFIAAARFLTLEEFGKFAFALSMANLFYLTTDGGMSLLFARELSAAPDRSAVWDRFFGLKVAYLGCTLMLGLLGMWALWPWDTPWLFLLGIGWMLGNSTLDFCQGVGNVTGRLVIAAFQMVVHRGLSIAAVVFVWLWHGNLMWTLIAFCLSSVIGGFLSLVILQKTHGFSLKPHLNLTTCLSLTREALPLGLANALGMLYLRVDMFLLGWWKGSQAAGLYGAAYRLFELAQILPAAVLAIGFPALVQTQREGWEPFSRMTKGVVTTLAWGAVGWFVVSVIGAHGTIHWVYGETYRGSVRTLQILGVCGLFVFANYLLTHYMVIFHRQRRHVLNQGLCLGWNVAANLVLIPRWGIAGAANAILSTHALLLWLTWRALSPHWQREK
ncbi:MAG: flippase [Elusimicrobia bacterium]|nr:flippase [Elusimicrobiota bacterium]